MASDALYLVARRSVSAKRMSTRDFLSLRGSAAARSGRPRREHGGTSSFGVIRRHASSAAPLLGSAPRRVLPVGVTSRPGRNRRGFHVAAAGHRARCA